MTEGIKKCILCVEDEPEMIDLMKLILSRRGFDVKGAAGGKIGLDMIRNERPDLILLDLMMPDMDGWEVYQQLKAAEATRGIPVIIVTAKAQGIDRVLGLQIAKVDDYIANPSAPRNCWTASKKCSNKKPSDTLSQPPSGWWAAVGLFEIECSLS